MDSFIPDELESSITHGILKMLEQVVPTPAQRCYTLIKAIAKLAASSGIPRELILDALANEYEITKLETKSGA